METFFLSNIASKCDPWKTSLDDLFTHARNDLIFDNLVIYGSGSDENPVDVIYARAFGRGKSAEAEVAWGSTVVSWVITEKKLIVESPPESTEQDRLQLPFILGVPIFVTEELISALIFIRYGGPEYSNQDQDFATFLADQVASIFRLKLLSELTTLLETERSTARLQFDFINTISHELRSPLGFIKGYATTLLRDDTQWDRKTQVDFLQIIEREANSLTDLIDNLLDSSRLQSGLMKFNFQAVRIDSLIRDEINRAYMANPARSMEFTCEKDIPTIMGDSRRLAQVFDNLLSNAQKYAPNSIVRIDVMHDSEEMKISFSDNGPGIPKYYLPKIFTRFFRVPENSLQEHGSGLGLSICKQIIELHNGTIVVDSNENGTTFTIKLPLNMETKSGEVKK